MSTGIRPITSANLHAEHSFTSIWNTRTVVVLLAVAVVGSIGIWIYRYFNQPAPRNLPPLDLDTQNIPWETVSKKLHLPPKEKSHTYEQQVQAFYHRFGQFIDRTETRNFIENFLMSLMQTKTVTLTPQARYQQFMTSLKEGSESDKSEAISIAIAHDFLDVAFHFTQIGIINQKQDWINWDKVLNEAAKQKRWDMVKQLLEQSSAKQEDGLRIVRLSLIIGFAAGDGQLDIVKLLLKKGRFPDNFVGFAFGQAAKIGRLDIMKVLSENIIIPPFHRFWAACNAHVKKYRDIIEYLGPQAPPQNDIDKAITSACYDNNPELVQYLLQLGGIPPEKAYQTAREKGSEEIAKLLAYSV